MSAPFYVLSSGDETDGSTPNTSLSSSSHDTSRARYHIQDITAFAEDLNCAAKSAFPNRGRSRYESVHVCLIRWQDDELLVQPELGRLNNVFQDYGFNTNVWEIPSKNSHLDLMIKTGQFIRSFDSEKNLFVIYYGGHGRIDSERQAEWTCKRDPSYARVHWSAIQTLFAEAKSDTLILLDTCAAASATTRSQYGSMEVIMASGFEARAPPPGEHSFTNTLIEVLESWINRPSFSASCLHAEILTELKMKPTKKGREGNKLEWCVTPIHLNCTRNSTAMGIELCRRNVLPRPCSGSNLLDTDERHTQSADAMDVDLDGCSETSRSQLSSLSPSGMFNTPHVLISVALEEDQPDLDVKKTARWLESIPFLAKWAKVEGIFSSYSTLLLLSIPVPIWNMLPDNPACSFVGYVTAPNLVAFESRSTREETHVEIKDRGGVKMEPILEEEQLSIDSKAPLITVDPQICIDEIKEVDPVEDNDFLTEFTDTWLSKQDSQWPSAADIRVKSFMHEHNFYPSGDPDSQLLNFLINRLRRGTQIESCGAKQYICLIQRVETRLSYLVKLLLDAALIRVNLKGTLEKSEVLKRYWAKRHEIWGSGHFYSVVSPGTSRESSPLLGTSVMSNINQQSIADSGYWTAGRRRDLDSAASPVLRDEDGSWKGGLDPETREGITDIELPSLKGQEQQRMIEYNEIKVQEWRSKAGASEHEEKQPQSIISNFVSGTSTQKDETNPPQVDNAPVIPTFSWNLPFSATYATTLDSQNPLIMYYSIPQWSRNTDSVPSRTSYDEDNDIPPVDDAASIRENRLVEDQVYFNKDKMGFNEIDLELSSRPRQWNDPPSLPYLTTTTLQPPTSNYAIHKWNVNADSISVTSRAASWGTRRRRSDISLAGLYEEPAQKGVETSLGALDQEGAAKGNFLTLIKRKVVNERSHGLFDNGLDRLANIVRQRTDKLKRSRSMHNIPEVNRKDDVSRQYSSGSLAPPIRASSFGRRNNPSINTAIAAMPSPGAVAGTTHARTRLTRSDPTAGYGASNQSFSRLMAQRVRSKSEISSREKGTQRGLVDLWRAQGGPPVVSLSSPIEAETKQPQPEPKAEDNAHDPSLEQ